MPHEVYLNSLKKRCGQYRSQHTLFAEHKTDKPKMQLGGEWSFMYISDRFCACFVKLRSMMDQ